MPTETTMNYPHWYRIVLSNARSRVLEEAEIRDCFDHAFFDRDEPPGMSLWIERRHDGAAVYYLSPVSGDIEPDLLQRWSAARSAPPPSTARRIAGSNRAAP